MDEKQIRSISLQAMLKQGVFRSIEDAEYQKERFEEFCYKKLDAGNFDADNI